MAAKFTELVIDAADPRQLGAWWAQVLNWEIKASDPEGTEVAGPPGAGPMLVFVPVPEAKTVKNRIHIDLSPVGCDQTQEVERLLGLGARRADVGQGEQTWVVLADPEGNEFCVLRSRVA